MLCIDEVRRLYDINNSKIRSIIHQMGGDRAIEHHRRSRTELYEELSTLQKKEHNLNAIENQLRSLDHNRRNGRMPRNLSLEAF